MHRSILVNQDVSDESRQALELAIWLADAANTHIHLAHYHPHKLPHRGPCPSKRRRPSHRRRSAGRAPRPGPG